MSKVNPWTTLSSQTIYKNNWITVREDQVIRPDGNRGIYSVVETRIATGTVALTAEGQVCLVGQFRYPTNCYSWEIVEGGTDENEPPLQAAKRELQEEAGLVANNWEILAPDIHLSNCFSSERAVLYLATDLTNTSPSPDGTEVLTVKYEALTTCLQMVYRGEFNDAMTIMGILLAARRLNVD